MEDPATDDPATDDPTADPDSDPDELEEDVEPVIVDLGEEIRVTVEANPESARIYDGEDLLGEGVATVLFTGDDAPAKALRVEADGFNPKEVELKPTDDKVMVELARKPTRPFRPRPRPTNNNKGMRVLP